MKYRFSLGTSPHLKKNTLFENIHSWFIQIVVPNVVIANQQVWTDVWGKNVVELVLVFGWWSGGRLNKKDGLTRYGDSHVKDKTS